MFPSPANSADSAPKRPPVTAGTLAAMRRRDEPIVALTAYDYTTAQMADTAGVDMLLVGDSLAMVVLGYDSTLPVPSRRCSTTPAPSPGAPAARSWSPICPS
jgi:ketopantoate hydroxymethyltransferase